MPPEDAEQPDEAERKELIGILSRELSKALDSAGTRDARPFRRRLNRFEYENTLCDVLGLDIDTYGHRGFAESLPEDTATDGMSPISMSCFAFQK